MSLNLARLRQSFELACPMEAAQQLFAEQFYHTLFARHPQVRQLFACTDMQGQARKLMATRALVLNGLTKPDLLLPALQMLGTVQGERESRPHGSC